MLINGIAPLRTDNQITATRILLSPPDTEVEEGALVPFMCTVIGWPIPFVTFSNWEESLMNNTNFTFKIVPEDSFTISLLMNLTYAKIEDTGHYYCLAEAGEVGYDRRSFFFGVFGMYYILFTLLGQGYHEHKNGCTV